MSEAVYFNSYKLKKDSSATDFLIAIEKLMNKVGTKSKGYISSSLFVDGETWADYSIWETMDDLNAFIASSRAASASGTNELAERFYSFCNFNSGISRRFSVERYYSFDKAHFVAPNVVSFHSYELNKGASAPDFLLSMDELISRFVSKQKGWVSSKLLFDGKTWADIVILEAKDDLEEFVKSCNQSDLSKNATSFMNFDRLRNHCFTIERSDSITSKGEWV